MDTLLSDCIKMDTDLLMLLDEKAYKLEKDRNRYFLVAVNGNSMKKAGIECGSVLVMDGFAKPKSGDIVIAKLYSGWTVKRLFIEKDHYLLTPENDAYDSIRVDKNDYIKIAGVVKASISER